MCPAFVPIFCVVPVSTGHPRRQFWGHQLLRCPLSPLGLAAEMMELKGGPWRAVQIQSHQAEQQRECDGIGMDAEGSNETTCSKMFKH